VQSQCYFWLRRSSGRSPSDAGACTLGQPQQRDVDEFGLASLDSLGDPDELEARARRAMAELGPDADRPDGADASNSVWVTTNGRGRVHSVEISRQWRDRLEPGDFGRALFQAYTSANLKAMAVAAAREEFADGAGSAAEPESWMDGSAGGDWLAQIRARLERVDEELLAADRRLAEGRASDEYERSVTSPAGYVTLKLNGDTLVGAASDVMAIRRADAESIRLDILDAFRDAGLLADR